MIIWSGWGILVIVSIICGFFGGSVATLLLEKAVGSAGGNYESALIFFHIALVNWILGRFLYRNKGYQVLVDHKTGENYQVRPNHSVFFIPFRAFTFLFLGIAAVQTYTGLHAKPIPEYSKESKVRFKKILREFSNSNEKSGGNTQEAILCAIRFQKLSNKASGEYFTGGKVTTRNTHTNFSTYCVQLPQSVVFITDIDDFSSYSDSEVQTTLRNMLWSIGSEVASEHGSSNNADMIIHLRDNYTSKVTLIGPIQGQFVADTSSASEKRLIYLFNIEAEPASIDSSQPIEIYAVDVKEVTPPSPGKTVSKNSEKSKPVSPSAKTGSEKSAPKPKIAPAFKSINIPSASGNDGILKERVWKNQEGKEMVATFVSFNDGQVSFTKSDGVLYKFPLEQLSEKDKELILSHLKKEN